MRLIETSLLAILLVGTTTTTFGQVVEEPTPPLASSDRLDWFLKNTAGASSVVGGAISAGWGTLLNQPSEYGPHSQGFGDRYAMRLTGISTGNAMEAGLGAIWGEDPRYHRAGGGVPFKNRIGHVVKWTFVAPNGNGELRPAYARFIAVAGNNFLSNTWREQSEADAGHALTRTLSGVAGRAASNAFDEFWPDAKRKLFHRRHGD